MFAMAECEGAASAGQKEERLQSTGQPGPSGQCKQYQLVVKNAPTAEAMGAANHDIKVSYEK